MRLIDADALINNLEMLILEQEEDDHVETWNNAITCSINEVKHHAPTIDAIKHGRWIGGELGHCSCCGHHGCASDIWSGCDDGMFCPNCGARMDERKES